MNIERLQALASRLRTVDPAKFTLRGWRQADGSRCTSCLASEMPEFALLGYGEDLNAWPTYRDQKGIGAFRLFFGLDRVGDTRWVELVTSDSDAPPSVIADRIDSMIAAELRSRGESLVTESTVVPNDRVDAVQMEQVLP